jgi:hypothetical protein
MTSVAQPKDKAESTMAQVEVAVHRRPAATHVPVPHADSIFDRTVGGIASFGTCSDPARRRTPFITRRTNGSSRSATRLTVSGGATISRIPPSLRPDSRSGPWTTLGPNRVRFGADRWDGWTGGAARS